MGPKWRKALAVAGLVGFVIVLLSIVWLVAFFLPTKRAAAVGSVLGVVVAAIAFAAHNLWPRVRAILTENSSPRKQRIGDQLCPARISVAPRQPPPSPFAGREDLLRRLTESLTSGSKGTKRVHVLTGPFGAGKTRITQELAQFAANNGLAVWWVVANSEVTLTCGMCTVALHLQVSREDLTHTGCVAEAIVPRLTEAYRREGRPWLLVIDDADQLSVLGDRPTRQDGTGWVRPPGPKGFVLVTTRDADRSAWNPRWVETHHVGRLAEEKAASVLRRYVPEESERAAGRLARRLGYLPLTLDLAGRYVSQASDATHSHRVDQATTFAAYTAALDDDQRFIKLLDAPIGDQADPDVKTIRRCWELNIRLMEAEGLHKIRPFIALMAGLTFESFQTSQLNPELITASVPFRGLPPGAVRQMVQRLVDFHLLEEHPQERQQAGRWLAVPPLTRVLGAVDPGAKKWQEPLTTLRHLLFAKTEKPELARGSRLAITIPHPD